MKPAANHLATFRFYAELNDFLSDGPTITRSFDVPGSVKDLIESCGVPHTEVDLIIVDGQSVGFDYQVQHRDRIAVYPVFESFDITPIVKVRPDPLRETSFVADVHLGTLARFIRLLGFDTVYDTALDDAELARISSDEDRILITRDVGLLKRGSVTHGYCVRSDDPRDQVIEVARRFHLEGRLQPFSRCMVCNGRLQPVTATEVTAQVPPVTRQFVDRYQRCARCEKVYWRGSHHDELNRIIEAVRQSRAKPGERNAETRP